MASDWAKVVATLLKDFANDPVAQGQSEAIV